MTGTLSPSSGARSCFCETPDQMLCSECVRSVLQPAHERHDAAKAEWVKTRRKCADYFFQRQPEQGPSIVSELQDQSQRLRDELERLRKECAAAAVKLCEMQISTEERQQQLQQQAAVAVNREKLHRLNRSICDCNSGALAHAIESAGSQVRKLRFQWALQAFQLHRLQVENPENMKRRKTQRSFVSGIGKIGGLPLPHAGPELFGVLPAEELQSALRLVASLTSLAAHSLGILLPHPILLQPGNADEGNIIVSGSGKQDGRAGSAGDASISSVVLGDADHNNGKYAAPSMDEAKVQQRIRHAVAAVIAEGQGSSTQYALSADKMNQDEFAIALQLLQNNIIALCIRAGVPVAQLWPGEAVLLNLHALHQFCQTQAQLQE